MINRKKAARLMSMPISSIVEKKKMPESLSPYAESANTLDDVFENLNTDFVFNENVTETEYNERKHELASFIESCCEEFSLGAMLPQPGAGAGVESDDLEDLASDPWMHDDDDDENGYTMPDVLREFVNNPGYKYTPSVECCVNEMLDDPGCPAYGCPLSNDIKKHIFDKELYKSKLRVADRMNASSDIIRDIQGEILGNERIIRRHIPQRIHYQDPKSSAERRQEDLERNLSSFFKDNEDLTFFPRGPLDECGNECGNECGTECGGNCSSPAPVSEKVTDVFKAARRFGEDLSADIRSEFNIIGGKLKAIEKNYIKTDASFVPFKKLRSTNSNVQHSSVNNTDMNMRRREKNDVRKDLNKRDKFMGNRTVVMMNGDVPWFKYVLDDHGNEKKRHIEFEFSSESEKYATYYRAIVMSHFKMMSPEIKDWISTTFEAVRKKGGVAEAPGNNAEDAENPDDPHNNSQNNNQEESQ